MDSFSQILKHTCKIHKHTFDYIQIAATLILRVRLVAEIVANNEELYVKLINEKNDMYISPSRSRKTGGAAPQRPTCTHAVFACFALAAL
jgi:hypothetical protein